MRTAVSAVLFTFDRMRTVLLALSFVIIIKCGLVLTALVFAR